MCGFGYRGLIFYLVAFRAAGRPKPGAVESEHLRSHGRTRVRLYFVVLLGS